MKRLAFLLLVCVALSLLGWAFSTNGKEGLLIFFLGAATLLCTLAVGGFRLIGSAHGKPRPLVTNHYAMVGAVIGLFLGGLVGVRSGFGRFMISIFNPDLPERDFGLEFGAIGGGLVGAFLVALLGGILQIVIARSEKGVTAADSGDEGSRGDIA